MIVSHTPILKWKQSNHFDSNNSKLFHGKGDVKCAYYSIPISPKHQKYFLYFLVYFQGKNLPIYMLSQCSLFMTTESFVIILARSLMLCVIKIYEFVALMGSLGFAVHSTRSLFVTTRCIECLGFVIKSNKIENYSHKNQTGKHKGAL